MDYVPYEETSGRPNIVVDGYGNDGTVMVLSHWPGSGTPPELADDLSTQIAFRYLDRPDLHVAAGAVTNNHFDEDGLCGIYTVLHPGDAQARRDAIVDVASAGDFATFRDRDSARISMTIQSYTNPETSPLPKEAFAGAYSEQSAALYRHALVDLPAMLDDVHAFKRFWEEEDARLQRSLDAMSAGSITIEELPDIDLAVVRVGDGFAGQPHDMAIFNATRCLRVLTLAPDRPSLRYRYETWVVYRSRPTMKRADMTPIAAALAEKDAVAWEAGDLGDLQPSVEPKGTSALPLDVVRDLVVAALRAT